MKLNAQGSSEKSWSWAALDHSDDASDPQPSLLAVRFKTVEEAKDFHLRFMEGVAVATGKSPAKGTSSVKN